VEAYCILSVSFVESDPFLSRHIESIRTSWYNSACARLGGK
jgi:hypothetical protein